MKNINISKRMKKGIKYALVPVAMSLCVVLSGCGVQNNYSNKPNHIDNYSYEETINIDNSNHQLHKIQNFKENTSINFTNKNYLNFKSYLDDIKINYEYSNIYNLSDALKEYNKLNLISHHNTGLKEFTKEKLFEVVKINNDNALSGKGSTRMYQRMSDEKLLNVCDMIIDTVKDFIKNNKDISEDRIKCVLSDLKIFEQKSSFSNAFVSYDNYLVISPNMMQITEILSNESKENDIIIHEIMHLLQKGCNCDLNNNKNLEQNFGVAFKFNNLDVNSLKNSWLYEASAEKCMVNYTNNEIVTYKTKISYLESLSLTNLLNDNYNINDTENLSFKRSLDDLYKYFNVETDGEKMEILNLMYSIEIMQQEPSDFYKKYKEIYGADKTDELRDKINYNVKSSACQTLSKLFYRNLAKTITNKNNVTLEDIFYLICLFENDMNNHLLYSKEQNIDNNDDFINKYVEIQDNFFYQLSLCLNVKQEEIEESFYQYSANEKTESGVIVKNYDLNFLSQEKIKYLEERQNELKTETTISVRQAQNELNKVKVYN